MIKNYDLLELGFSPKYEGFKLLLEAVNKKIEKNLSCREIFKLINPEHPGTVEKNIRVCALHSGGKYSKLTTTKVVEDLCKRYSRNEHGVRVKFEKVSFKQFKKDVLECGFKFSDGELHAFYESIKLPKRATTGSAGYDFYAPIDLVINKDEVLKFPTGIKCYMDGDVVLQLYPRSGLGFKYGMQLYNTCGIIDAKTC